MGWGERRWKGSRGGGREPAQVREGLVRPGLCRRVGVTTHAQSEEELLNGDSTVCKELKAVI